MKHFLSGFVIGLVFIGGYALGQNCIIPVPPSPPKAVDLVIHLSQDGGACSGYAIVTGGQPPTTQAIPGIAKCNTAKQIADQMAAIDNGWNDGGSP